MALVLLEPESLVQTLSWRTDILKSHSGLEQRVSLLSFPRERYEIDYILLDDNDDILDEEVRQLRRDLFVDPVTAWTLPLRHEALVSTNNVTGTTFTANTTLSDWVIAGRAVLVENEAGDYYTSTISTATGHPGASVNIVLNDSPPVGPSFAAGRTRLMPVIPVLLDDASATGRYQVGAAKWHLQGLRSSFETVMGTGATVTTFDSLPVLDQLPDLPGLAEEQFHAEIHRHDYGAVATQENSLDQVDIGRAHHYIAESGAGRQYWKKFLSTVRGRQKPFLLPTWRADLISETGTHDGTTALVVKAPPDDAVNYEDDYFGSSAHRRLQFEYADGSIEYKKATNATDNLDGTLTITLSASASAGALARISFLEAVRLADDSIALVHASDHIEVSLRALTVQGESDTPAATFDAEETSNDGSRPIELYEIVTTKGTYRRTSHNANYTYSSNLYTAVPSMRSGISGGTLSDPPEMIVTLPATDVIITDHAFSMPSRSMVLTVYRVQQSSGAAVVWWTGKITGIAVEGKVGRLRSEDKTGAAISTSVSSVYIQRLCNHALYDARCAVVRASFDVATTVAAVSTNGREITVTADGGNPDQWLKAGEIVRDSDGERRMVIDHTGLVLTIDAPFQTIGVGNAITLFAGCDHTVHTCRDKFSNVANFGGHPAVPQGNPFKGDFRGIAVSILE